MQIKVYKTCSWLRKRNLFFYITPPPVCFQQSRNTLFKEEYESFRITLAWIMFQIDFVFKDKKVKKCK